MSSFHSPPGDSPDSDQEDLSNQGPVGEDEDGRSVLDWQSGLLPAEQIVANLSKHGYVRIRKVIPVDKCEQLAKNEFWKGWAKQTAPGWKRSDRRTWTEEIRPTHERGRLNCKSMSNQDFAMHTRETVKPVFEKVLRSTEIVSSLEGPSVAKYPKRCTFKSLSDWNKKDMGFEKDSLRTEQIDPYQVMNQYCSVVSLVDEDVEGQVMSVVPGSHKYFSDIKSVGAEDPKAPVTEDAKARSLSGKLTVDQIKYVRKNLKLQLLRVPLKAGDMILYYPTLVYGTASFCKSCDVDAAEQLHVRVAMDIPDAYKFTEVMKARKDAWEKGWSSTSCVQVFRRLPSSCDFVKSATVNVPPMKLNVEQQRLMGHIPYDMDKMVQQEKLIKDRMAADDTNKKAKRSKKVEESEKEDSDDDSSGDESDDSSSSSSSSEDEEAKKKAAKKAAKKEKKAAKKEAKKKKKDKKRAKVQEEEEKPKKKAKVEEEPKKKKKKDKEKDKKNKKVVADDEEEEMPDSVLKPVAPPPVLPPVPFTPVVPQQPVLATPQSSPMPPKPAVMVTPQVPTTAATDDLDEYGFEDTGAFS